MITNPAPEYHGAPYYINQSERAHYLYVLVYYLDFNPFPSKGFPIDE